MVLQNSYLSNTKLFNLHPFN